ncbi:MAG: DsbA family protein [Paracoccaceae bacterium]
MNRLTILLVLWAGLATAGLFWLVINDRPQSVDIAALDDLNRQAFRDQVRAYLMESPEVLVDAITVLERRQAEDQSVNDKLLISQNAEDLFADGVSFEKGNPEGDIIMVEFLDYRCTFCKRADPEIRKLLSADDNIRFILKEYPILGDESELASRFAISVLNNAGAQAYADVHDILMDFRGTFTVVSLERVAVSLDLDAAAIMATMDAPEVSETIDRNRALAQRMRINGTPGFVLGDQIVRGFIPLENMQDIVAQQRQQEG